MGFFSKIGAAVGIGAADVEVRIERDRYVWGDTVRGTALVKGGTVEQTATEILAHITEHWTTQDSDGDTEHHYRHYGEKTIAVNVAIPVGSSQTFPFEVTIPGAGNLSHDWSAAVRVGVPRAADRTGQTPFILLPTRPILGLVTALQAVAPFQPSNIFGRGTETTVDFRPPDDAKDELDGVKFIVQEANGTVTGTLEINPQEKTLGDRMKAMVGKDRVKHPIGFPADALAAGVEGTPPAEVVGRLRELLRTYLK